MRQLVLFILLCGLSVAIQAQEFRYVQCQLDSDCHDGEYCQVRLGQYTYCQPCEDCANRFYRQSGRATCPKNAFECGDCLDGFVQDTWSKKRYSDKCRPTQNPNHQSLTSSPETTAENLEEHNDEKNSPNFWVIFVAVMIAVIAIISGFATFWHKKKLAFRLAEAQQSPAQCQSPPPPYYDHDHQVLEQDHLEETRQVMMQPPHGNVMTNTEVKTRAVPFQYPNYDPRSFAPTAPSYNDHHDHDQDSEDDDATSEASTIMDTSMLNIPEFQGLLEQIPEEPEEDEVFIHSGLEMIAVQDDSGYPTTSYPSTSSSIPDDLNVNSRSGLCLTMMRQVSQSLERTSECQNEEDHESTNAGDKPNKSGKRRTSQEVEFEFCVKAKITKKTEIHED